jgi:hypothetical protein
MTLNGFSSTIQLFATFYFGFLGLGGVRKISEYAFTFRAMLENILNNDDFLEKSEKYKDDHLYHQLKKKKEKLLALDQRMALIESSFKGLFYQIFIESGIFSLFLLILCGLENSGFINYLGIIILSIYFIICDITRIILLFTPKRSDNTLSQRNKFPITVSFSSFEIDYLIFTLIRKIFYFAFLTFLYLAPIIFSSFSGTYYKYYGLNQTIFYATSLSLFALATPYLLLFSAVIIRILMIAALTNSGIDFVSSSNKISLISLLENKEIVSKKQQNESTESV